MYSLLDAFQGDYTEQAAHYERRMRQLQQQVQQMSAGSQTGIALDSVSQQPGSF